MLFLVLPGVVSHRARQARLTSAPMAITPCALLPRIITPIPSSHCESPSDGLEESIQFLSDLSWEHRGWILWVHRRLLGLDYLCTVITVQAEHPELVTFLITVTKHKRQRQLRGGRIYFWLAVSWTLRPGGWSSV